MTSLRLLAVLLVTGCRGTDRDTPDGRDFVDTGSRRGTRTDTVTRVTDSGLYWVPDEPFVVAWLLWTARFGWDAEAEALVALETAAGPIAPSIDLWFGSADWVEEGLPVGAGLSCRIVLPLTDPSPPAWVADDPTLWGGFAYTADLPGGQPSTTCTAEDETELDPAVWGGPAEVVASGTWGVAIGEVSPEAAAAMEGWSSTSADRWLGAAFDVSAWVSGPDREALSGAYAVDDRFELLLDADGLPVLLDAAAAHPDGGGLGTGWYEVSALAPYAVAPPDGT